MNPIVVVVSIIFIFLLQNTKEYIYVLVILGILLIYYFTIVKKQNYNETKKVSSDIKWKKFNELTKNKVVYSNAVYNIHKGPDRLKYIFMHQNLKLVIEDLDFIMKYQQDLFLDIIIYIEYFLKIHYNILIGKYDPCTYIPILKDIQKHVVILLSTTIFNLPNTSTIIDIPNLDQFIERKTMDIKAILGKYMTILKHKYYKQCSHQFNLIEYDHYSNNYEIVP